MGSKKETRGRGKAGDWEIHHQGGILNLTGVRYRRDREGGYLFTGTGREMVAEFPPGAIFYIAGTPPPLAVADLTDEQAAEFKAALAAATGKP